MTAIVHAPVPASPPGNTIVPVSADPISFPILVLAAVVVAGGIYLVDQFDSRASWLMAFLILLSVAFGYKEFGNQLISIFGGQPIQPKG